MFNFFKKHKLQKGETFKNIMRFSEGIDAVNAPLALHDLVKILLRPLQSRHLVSAITEDEHGALPFISQQDFFIDGGVIKDPHHFKHLNSSDFVIRLSSDPILPTPWRKNGCRNCINLIGVGKPWGAWEQDHSNHHVSVLMPWGIAFVQGGNHSIAMGVIKGCGEIVPEHVYDMSELFDLIHTDGKSYYLTKTGGIISSVKDEVIAAVFEIGRAMTKNCVRPMLK